MANPVKLKNVTPQEYMQQSKGKFQSTSTYRSGMNSSLWKQLWGDATEAKERTEHAMNMRKVSHKSKVKDAAQQELKEEKMRKEKDNIAML